MAKIMYKIQDFINNEFGGGRDIFKRSTLNQMLKERGLNFGQRMEYYKNFDLKPVKPRK
tara:strand:+ start:158 stop:334 length:177 start_codon:yes stop_codon:yes gene_type:complete